MALLAISLIGTVPTHYIQVVRNAPSEKARLRFSNFWIFKKVRSQGGEFHTQS